ncbi:MAG: tetratricopeptide repeat protein [Alphaproteobacteria bacterium]
MSKHSITEIIKNAKQGNKQAQYTLGCMYIEGEGVRINLSKAKFWLEKSAEAGHLLAIDKKLWIEKYESEFESLNILANLASKEFKIREISKLSTQKHYSRYT